MAIIKNKKYQISIHLSIWLVLLFLPIAFSMGSDISSLWLLKHFWIQIVFLAVIFYTNFFYLIKKLENNERVFFIVSNILLIFLLIFLKFEIYEIIDTHKPLAPVKRNKPPQSFRYFTDFMFFIIPVAFSVAISSGKKMSQAEEIKREADTIKLKAELQHLKYQLQPHFFFNALNNIYSLIEFAPDKAQQSIHSLSKLMRHLLYKTDVEKIKLSEEVEFLNKYIDLMSLRLNDKTKINIDFPALVPNIEIAPLLFISIVENAFKHGVSATKNSDIYFKIEINGDEVTFIASNSNFPKNDTDKSGSGIGVENLQKRLNLLYPQKHTYNSHIQNEKYIATIKLQTN